MSDRMHPDGEPGDLSADTAGLLLFLITALGTILRLYHLGSQSLWVDEMITIDQATLGPSLWRQFLDDYQSPLPMLIVHGVGKISPSEAMLRLPGALLAAGTVPLLYVLARCWIGARAALFAALMLSVNPFHIYHAQEVRGYAYLVFFGLAATAIAVSAPARLSWWRATALVAMGVAAALSNLQGLLWMASLGLALLAVGWWRRPDRARWLLAFGLIAALTAPWWSGGLGTHESVRLLPGEVTGVPLRGETTFSPWAIPYAAFVLSGGATLGPPASEIHLQSQRTGRVRLDRRYWGAVAGLAGICLVLAVAGAVALRRKAWWLLLWVLLPVAVAAWLAMRNVKPFNPRYVIAALPVVMIWMGAGLTVLPRRAAFFVMLAWLTFMGFALQRYYFDDAYAKEDVRGAAQLIEARETLSDFILAPTVGNVFAYYYRGPNPIRLHTSGLTPTPEAMRDRIVRLEPGRRYIWYVRARPWHDDPNGILLQSLEETYGQLARFELTGAQVLLYDRAATPQGGAD